MPIEGMYNYKVVRQFSVAAVVFSRRVTAPGFWSIATM